MLARVASMGRCAVRILANPARWTAGIVGVGPCLRGGLGCLLGLRAWVVVWSEFWQIRLRGGGDCWCGPCLRCGLGCLLALRAWAVVRSDFWRIRLRGGSCGSVALSPFPTPTPTHPTNNCARAKISSPRSPWQKLRTRFIHSVSSWNAAASLRRVNESLGDSPQDCT